MDLTPSQFVHLQRQVAADDRRLRGFKPNVSNHKTRESVRHWRHAWNAGMTAENAFDPCWWRWFGEPRGSALRRAKKIARRGRP